MSRATIYESILQVFQEHDIITMEKQVPSWKIGFMEASKEERSAYVDSGSLVEGSTDNLVAMEGELAVRLVHVVKNALCA
jgi:hypothetical protein